MILGPFPPDAEFVLATLADAYGLSPTEYVTSLVRRGLNTPRGTARTR